MNSNPSVPLETQRYCGQPFTRSDGETVTIEPTAIIYSPDVLGDFGMVCRCVTYITEGPANPLDRRATVLFDTRTHDVAGAAAVRALQQDDWTVQELLIPDRPDGGAPVCDTVTHADVLARMHQADLVVTVGSGVVNDLGKWAAFDAGVPYVSFATAASMNGYTSANVAATVDGVKTLQRAAPAKVVAANPAIIRDAPFEMTAAGLGDVLAKNVSSVDWRLNQLLFDDPYCQRTVDLVAEIEPLYVDAPQAVAARRPRAINAIFDALLLTGIGMTLAGSSAPASGGEHLISHSLDMMASIDGHGHDLHGRQVGVGTLLTTALYEQVLAVESPELVDPPAEIDQAFWGPLAEGVAVHYAEKQSRLIAAKDLLSQGNTWDQLRSTLAPMLRGAHDVRHCLQEAGAAWSAEHIGCDRQRLLDAFVRGHEIRSRFTVLDLANLLGLMPQAAEGILDAWA